MIQGRDFSHMTNDLVGAIDRGEYPKWDLYIQTLKPGQMAALDYDPLDPTKIWPDVPERKVGQMVLNRNVDNFYQETEQVTLAPSNLVPGIEPSEDRLLQGRLFSYADTQMYRVGANAMSLPVNQPKVTVNNGNQDGALNAAHTVGNINYEPSRIQPRPATESARYSRLPLSGTTQQQAILRTQNFKQAGELYRSYDSKNRRDLVNSFGQSLAGSDDESKHIILSFLYKADAEYGKRVCKVAGGDLAKVKQLAAQLKD